MMGRLLISLIAVMHILCSTSMTHHMERELTLCTYNCRGHGKDRIEYMQKLLTECDILFIQEHWYLDNEIQQLDKEVHNVTALGKSGVNENKLLPGRPYGGCALIYKKTLQCTIHSILCSNRRVHACVESFLTILIS